MKANVRHSLVQAALVSGSTVMSKQASATPEQAEVLAAAWPGEGTTKLAALSQIIASGVMVEEADAAAVQA